MKTILTFFEKFNQTVPDRDVRLDCLEKLNQAGMYRKKKKLEVELFSDPAIEYLDHKISVVKVNYFWNEIYMIVSLNMANRISRMRKNLSCKLKITILHFALTCGFYGLNEV